MSYERRCLFSSVVERYPCKVVVASSILAGGLIIISYCYIKWYITMKNQRRFLVEDLRRGLLGDLRRFVLYL